MNLKSVLILLLLAGLSAPAYAGHPSQDRRLSVQHLWAVEYAETALRQVREARRQGCGFTGNRWSMNYRNHYEWALRTERRKGLIEIDRRNEALGSCHGRYTGNHGYRGGDWYGGAGQRHRPVAMPDMRYLQRVRPEEFARWYADTAVVQSEQNRIDGCGYRGANGRWRGDWRDHYRFALQADRHTSIREVEIRADQLNYCGSHG